MASLSYNLTQINDIKLQIKEVLNTNSYVFSEYPSLIEAAIQGGGGGITPSGTSYITENGEHDVTSYAYAYVNVPQPTALTVADWYDGNYDTKFNIINDGVLSGNNYSSAIEQNFSYTQGNDSYILTWEEVGQNDEIIKVQISTNTINPEDLCDENGDFREEFYYLIYPILTDWEAEAGDIVEDGYDYLLTGDLLVFNIQDCTNVPEEITLNGFYPNNGSIGFNVNVEGGSTGLGFPMLMFKEWGLENWKYAVADNNNMTVSFNLNAGSGVTEKMVDYIAISNYNGEDVDRMNLKPLSIDCSGSARENWPSSYTGIDYYYWSNAPADPSAEGYHYDANADTIVSFFELTNLEDPETGDTFEGEVTVNLSYNTSTGVWSATWNEAVGE